MGFRLEFAGSAVKSSDAENGSSDHDFSNRKALIRYSGRKGSISLEEVVWRSLKEIASHLDVTLLALLTNIVSTKYQVDKRVHDPSSQFSNWTAGQSTSYPEARDAWRATRRCSSSTALLAVWSSLNNLTALSRPILSLDQTNFSRFRRTLSLISTSR
jgi:Ribbon-helix-helix domain